MGEPDVDYGVPDVTQLIDLSEESVIGNLRERYEHDEIHTFTGNILLVVNPYRRLPVYDTSCMELFKGVRINRAPPHVYAIAEEAYNRLRKEQRAQAIVVSGESGAGKTETNKYLMRYLMWRAHSQETSGHLTDAILQSNPILEAFGNAKTGRNHNSSRFGKFVKLHIGSAGTVEGAVIATYLLEKSRVAFQGQGERNYHIFYQLQAGAEPAERERLRLKPSAADYGYLSQSGVLEVPGVDDADELEATMGAMDYVAISDEDQQAALQIVAALMHLGSLTFEAGADDAARVANAHELEPVNELLGIDDIRPLLLERKMRVPGAEFNIALTPPQSKSARDAFAKAFYELLFRWLTRAINVALVESSDCDFMTPFIGLLDVYGFEIFPLNSFEQLCINFVNEKLHQFFLQFVFKMEARLYEEECVHAGHIVYEDNQGCIDLVEKPPSGIFKLLDSQCITPQASDGKFCAHVNEEHRSSAFLGKPRAVGAKGLSPDGVFVVRHFAGEVVYTAEGFLQKNNDALDPFFRVAIEGSRVPLLVDLIAFSGGTAGGPGAKKRKKGGESAAFISLSKRFLAEMSELLSVLHQSGAHFVRCMKPNMRFAPGEVEFDTVLRQLHANGTFEAVRLMQNGYPIRVPFELLHSRYLPLLVHDVPAVANLTPAQFCELIAAVVGVSEDDYKTGTTRIFLRGDAGAAFEELRDKDAAEVLPVLKAKMVEWEAKARAIDCLRPYLTMWVHRSKFVRWRKCAVRVQSRFRGGRGRERAALRLLEAQAERELHRIEQREKAVRAARKSRKSRKSVEHFGAGAPGADEDTASEASAGERADAAPAGAPDDDDDERAETASVATDFSERSEMERMMAKAPRFEGYTPTETPTETPVETPGSSPVQLPRRTSVVPPLPPLSKPVEEEVVAVMKTKDYNMMEQEMRSLISKIRAEAALKEAQLLKEIKSAAQEEPRGSTAPPSSSFSIGMRRSFSKTSIFGRLINTVTNGPQTERSEADDGEEEEARRRALIRPSRGAPDMIDLVIVEEGMVLPLFKKTLRRAEVDRGKAVFDKWDQDKDGSISLAEFLYVMQRLAEKQGRKVHPRKIEAMFHIADIDNNGVINFEEFLVMQMRRQARERGETTRLIPNGRRASTIPPPSGMAQGSGSFSIPLSARGGGGGGGGGADSSRGGDKTRRFGSDRFGPALMKEYDSAEPGGYGVVERPQFERLVTQTHVKLLGHPPSDRRLHKLWRIGDPDNTGRIDLHRYVTLEAVRAFFAERSPPAVEVPQRRPGLLPLPGSGQAPVYNKPPTQRIPLPGSEQLAALNAPNGRLSPRAIPLPSAEPAPVLAAVTSMRPGAEVPASKRPPPANGRIPLPGSDQPVVMLREPSGGSANGMRNGGGGANGAYDSPQQNFRNTPPQLKGRARKELIEAHTQAVLESARYADDRGRLPSARNGGMARSDSYTRNGGAPPSARGAPPSARGAPPSARGAPPSARGVPPSMRQGGVGARVSRPDDGAEAAARPRLSFRRNGEYGGHAPAARMLVPKLSFARSRSNSRGSNKS